MFGRQHLSVSGLLFAGCLACAVALVGCDKEGGEGDQQQRSQSSDEYDFRAGDNASMFTFVVASDPETFDPAKMSGAPEGRVSFQLFEGLMAPNVTTEGLEDASDVIVPGVAESYEVSEDGKTYTFNLREDAKWSNGEPLTSEDFMYSWERVLTPETGADYASMMYVIEGAKEFHQDEDGELDFEETVGVSAPDDHTLEVTLRNPTPYFPELTAFYTFFPVPKDVVEEHGSDWTRPENIVSNGAYVMAEYEEQRQIIFEKSEEYWDADNVELEEAKGRIIADRNAVTNAYRSGELHWSGASLPVSQIASFVAHPDYRQDPMLGVYFFRINVEDDSPLQDKKVRQALSKAVERNSLVEDVLNGLHKEANTFVPPMAGWESSAEVENDNKEARKLLAEAGYEDGEDFPTLQLLYNTDEDHKLIAEAVQKQLNRNLGIDVELVNKEWKMYLQDVDNVDYDIARAGWIGDYNDPMTFLDMWESDNGNNDTGWANEEYDALLEQARQEVDVDKRREILQEAEELLLEEGPVIPVYHYTNNILVSRFVDGLEPHNRDIHLLKYMSLPE